MSFAQSAVAAEALDPVAFVVLRSLELFLVEKGGIAVQEVAAGQQVPGLPGGVAFVAWAVVLFEAAA